jgi:ribulose-phosphate 3-epimerase
VTVHQEACRHLQATLDEIRKRGARAGVSLCPATPVGMLEELEDDVDLVLIMTVNPGFGGQSLIPRTISKVGRARRLLDSWAREVELEVDGGVNTDTIGELVEQGADVCVAGSAVFDQGAIEANINKLRAAAALVAAR